MSKNCCALKCVIICHKMPKELVVSCQLPVVCRRVRGSGFSEGEAGGLRVEGGGDELRGALNHLRSTFNPLTSILNPPTSTLQPQPSNLDPPPLYPQHSPEPLARRRRGGSAARVQRRRGDAAVFGAKRTTLRNGSKWFRVASARGV